MMTKAFIGMGAVLLAASMAFAQTQGPAAAPGSDALTEVRRAIDRGNAQWVEAWAKGDPAMVSSLFADDGAQLTGNGKVVKGPQQIRERQKAGMQGADPGVKVTVTTVNVWLDGDTAYEAGKYKYEYTEKGKPGKDEGRYVTIWKRQKGGPWKISMSMGVPE